MRTNWYIIILLSFLLVGCKTKQKVVQESRVYDLQENVDAWDFDTTFFFSSTPFDSVPTLNVAIRHRHKTNARNVAQRDSSLRREESKTRLSIFPDNHTVNKINDLVFLWFVVCLTIVCLAFVVRRMKS